MSSAILLRRRILSSLSTSNLEKYTWDEISQISKQGKASEYFSIGETKQFYNQFEDRWQTARIIGMNYDYAQDSSYGRFYAGLTFETEDTSNIDFTFTYPLNTTLNLHSHYAFIPTNYPFDGSIPYCQIMTLHTNFLTDKTNGDILPITPVSKYMIYKTDTDVQPGDESTNGMLEHYVFPLSATELGFSSSLYSIPQYETALGSYEYYKNATNSTRKKNSAYLTRTLSYTQADYSFAANGTLYNDVMFAVNASGKATTNSDTPVKGKISYGFCI